ncbi:MAG: tetratricopeptide repeat protein [Elusimicrobia bacterium]|nr:tetratricopeptide repeat protein [Elusimicrobiota bacterium]
MKRISCVVVFILVGFVISGGAASPQMQACRAAYETKDPWKVFETCGQLIADGDLPADANVWDWLALAERQVDNEEPNWGIIKEYWRRSEESGQKTGRMAFKNYDDAKGEQVRNEEFKKIAAYGPWMMSYAYSHRAHTYRRGNNLKQAIADMTQAIKLAPHYKDYFSRSEWYEAFGKYPAQNKDLLDAVKLSESVGNLNSNAHTKIKYDDPNGFNAYIKDMDPVSQYRRGKFLKKETAGAVDWCLYNFLGPYETALPACEEAARSTPDDPRGHNYLAATLLKQPAPDFERADAALDAALRADPQYARALINRGASLRLQGKFEEALKAIQAALAIDPGLSAPAGFANLGFIHAGLGNFDEAVKNWNLLLAKNPWDDAALRHKAVALTKAGRLNEALYASAQLIAYKPLGKNYELRGDIQSVAGNDLLAAQNYLIAMQMNESAFKKLYPKWSAARETFLSKQGDVKPANLLEVIAPLPTYVREKGNPEPKFVSTGLRTQWQPDGSLRFWTQNDDGFYLLPDGVKFQKALDKGGRGPVQSPEETSGGKRVYPLGEFSVAWLPSDSFYFGLLAPVAPSSNGRHVFVNGMEYGGPFLFGQSVHAMKEVSRRTEGDKVIIAFTDGVVETTQPGRQARIDIPGAGWFQGDITQNHLPYTGVLTRDDGQWSLFYKGDLLATTQKGTATTKFPERDSSIVLRQDGEVYYHFGGVWEEKSVTYPASGAEPIRTAGNVKLPSWRDYEEGRRKFEEKEALEDALRAARSYVPETTRRVCSRCNGSGQLWHAGGASQERVSAPSGSSSSQREDFYNSASSVRTNYSSGSMGICPVCNGTGRP